MQILSPDGKAELSFTGLAFSPDGTRIYLSNVNGDIKVFGVGRDKTISPLFSIALPLAKAPERDEEIPAGIAVSADGKKIYVAGNLSNRLIELDTATGKILRISRHRCRQGGRLSRSVCRFGKGISERPARAGNVRYRQKQSDSSNHSFDILETYPNITEIDGLVSS